MDYKEVLKSLMEGNSRFASGAAEHPRQDKETLLALSGKQSPKAVVITCSDSRLSPEIIFDQGLGDLFVIRTAGKMVDTAVLASAEYAAVHLHVPLMVILGHKR